LESSLQSAGKKMILTVVELFFLAILTPPH